MSNANARFLFDELGLPFDFCGSITGRILLASVDGCTATDPGVPTTTTQMVGGGQIVDCGRRPGYLPDRLAVLREVAVFAATHDLDVVWG